MEGISVTPLLKVPHPLGSIYRGIKASEHDYDGFGEAYFTTINHGAIKGWKLHTRMRLNLIVPVGSVRFVVIHSGNPPAIDRVFQVTLSQENYQRLTVHPGAWVAFQGIGQGPNLVLNVASIEHNPDESVNCPIETFSFDWSLT